MNSVMGGRRDGGWIFCVVWRIGRERAWGGSDGSGGSGGWCGVFGENILDEAGAVRQGLGAMMEFRMTSDQPDQIEERVRLGGGDVWRFVEEGMGVWGLRAAVGEGRLVSCVAGEGTLGFSWSTAN